MDLCFKCKYQKQKLVLSRTGTKMSNLRPFHDEVAFQQFPKPMKSTFLMFSKTRFGKALRKTNRMVRVRLLDTLTPSNFNPGYSFCTFYYIFYQQRGPPHHTTVPEGRRYPSTGYQQRGPPHHTKS